MKWMIDIHKLIHTIRKVTYSIILNGGRPIYVYYVASILESRLHLCVCGHHHLSPHSDTHRYRCGSLFQWRHSGSTLIKICKRQPFNLQVLTGLYETSEDQGTFMGYHITLDCWGIPQVKKVSINNQCFYWWSFAFTVGVRMCFFKDVVIHIKVSTWHMIINFIWKENGIEF